MSENIGDRIKKIVKEKGYNIEWLAMQLGITKQSLYKTLSKDSFNTTTLEKISTVLNVGIEDLLNVKIKVSKASPLIYKNPELLQLFKLDFENYLHEIDFANISHKSLLDKLEAYPAIIETRLRQYEIHRVSSKDD